VLDFDETKTIKLFLVAVLDQAEGVEETQRLLRAQFIFKGHAQRRRRLGLLSRCKRSCSADKGGKDSELHGESVSWDNAECYAVTIVDNLSVKVEVAECGVSFFR
jgi:hypothetical protein